MGDLPANRVRPSRPFSYAGVNYAGPIFIREGKRRNAQNIKTYIAVFVCFATKAVHLELVGDLTTDSFLGALKRFLSRRGKAITLYSDNGTAFVGAARELKEIHQFLSQDDVQSDIRKFLLESHISWEFIPPNAPHFGGLWEAAVKSAKHHMYRIIGNAHLSYEEMLTLLCEIEAILNPRPITPLSADPNDINCLTPGHFLIGEELNSFPRLDITDQKSKWMSSKGAQLQAGQLVLIKQQGLAPLLWKTGRIQDLHTGGDGVTRSATVKTSNGLLMRPLSKLCILPIES
ncbi:PREDICTED: uncharacterized protein LOC105557008 [Vollenhovia emeryi]|uniref:uncharacterized protein LOC105557008 n=1 Tax=Vollenhovia emeryi TaxID=411798 RepID=UPI0005F450F2|nr:PREDICTED: uncharacterized protein LOC105557008 [Vollenhovia emeryi]